LVTAHFPLNSVTGPLLAEGSVVTSPNQQVWTVSPRKASTRCPAWFPLPSVKSPVSPVHASAHLAAQYVEVLRGRGAIDNLEIVFSAKLQEAFQTRAGMFRATAFSLGSLGAVVVFMGISAMRFLAPFFFQGVRGFSPAGVGLLLMPGAAVTALVAPFVGRIADRYGVRLFANVGFFVALAGLVTFTRIDVGTPTWLVVTGLMILALGMAAFSAPNSTSILNSVPADAHGVAAGFVNLCRNTGNVMGIAYGTAVVTLAMGSAGFAPSLSAVGPGSSREVFAAFTHGVQLTSISLVLLAVPVLGLLLLFARGTRTARR